MERLWRLSLFNMDIDQCLVEDRALADHYVDHFYSGRTKLLATGRIYCGEPLLEASLMSDMGFGDLSPTVVVQILDSTVITVGEWTAAESQNSRFLHELDVLLWETDLMTEELTLERPALLRRRSGFRLLVVLDRPFEVSAIHAQQRDHIAMIMTRDEYDYLAALSSELADRVDAALSFSLDVRLARTEQQITELKRSEDIRLDLRCHLYAYLDGLIARFGVVSSLDCMAPVLKWFPWTGTPHVVDFRDAMDFSGLYRYLRGDWNNNDE